MDEFRNLAMAIKQARISKGFSQEEFAEVLDVSSTHVKHMESGHRKPSLEILFKICSSTDLSIDDVLGVSKTYHNEADVKLKTLINLCSEKEKILIIKIIEALISVR